MIRMFIPPIFIGSCSGKLFCKSLTTVVFQEAEEAKIKKRKKRRRANSQLKQWLQKQDTLWTLGKRSKHEDTDTHEEQQWSSRDWKLLHRAACSKAARRAVREAWMEWEAWNGSRGSQQESSFHDAEEHQSIPKAFCASGKGQHYHGRWRDFCYATESCWWEMNDERKRNVAQHCQEQHTNAHRHVDPQVRNCLLLLGLSDEIELSTAELRDAFKQVAMQWHPDRHEPACKAVAEARFKEAQAAYHFLLSMAVNR